MMVSGICLFLSPMTAIMGYIPLVGGLVSGTMSIAILMGALLLCLPLFLLALSMAWLCYHRGIGCLILSAVVIIFCIFLIAGGPSEEVKGD
jgi:hypothetical protein